MAHDDSAALNEFAIIASAMPMRRQLKAAAAIKRPAVRTTFPCASIPDRVHEEASASNRLDAI